MPIPESIVTLYLRTRLWLGKKRYGTFTPKVVRVSDTRLIKGPCFPSELEGLRYVAQHTTIPVPKVHHTYPASEGRSYIEMDYIKGDNLQEIWRNPNFTSTNKQAVINEVASYIDQLRQLTPPQEGIVASAELGECYDIRVGSWPFGPFKTIDEFHDFLRGTISIEDTTKVYGEAVTKCHERSGSSYYRTCFTHADIAKRNIIVRDGKVAGIVDWQFSGWFPEYWEYTKAFYTLYDVPDWYGGLKKVMRRYDDELEAERVLWERFDQPGDLLRTRYYGSSSKDG
ncbi:hypothetical protein AtubIFM57258_003660 [Aspergillus tubingensis]|nr:hypothetical protein AtubIFM57258_003660 [Aspergillus tubingensis]